MTRIAIALTLAITASAASADLGAFLPSLTFPQTTAEPTVSTLGCLPQQTCPAPATASQ